MILKSLISKYGDVKVIATDPDFHGKNWDELHMSNARFKHIKKFLFKGFFHSIFEIFNKLPLGFYERFFGHLIPAEGLYFKLRVIK